METKPSRIEKLVYKMLTTNTGTHFLDSGGESGRAWQRNQQKTLKGFQDEPEVEIDSDIVKYPIKDSSELTVRVSTFHHLVNSLELDEVCNRFNALTCADWDSDVAYGLSVKQESWLRSQGFIFHDTWNSYNDDSNLSQTLQGCNLDKNFQAAFEFPEYILLQIHNGADVRGGYTDAKLFKVKDEYFDLNPTVYGEIDGHTVSTAYDGNTFVDDINYEPVEVKPDSKIEVWL